MPSLFRFLLVVGLLGGLVYGGMFALANFVDPKPREMTVTIPPDKFVKPHAERPRWRAGRSATDETLIELFLDMLAAERGAGAQHARRLSPRPRRFLRASRASTAAAIADADTDDAARLSRRPRRARACKPPRWRGGSRRSASSTASSMPKAIARDDPAAVLEGPEARPRAAEGASDRARSTACSARRATA